MSIDLVLLADCTAIDKVFDKEGKTRPPVVTFKDSLCAEDTHMTREGRGMNSVKQGQARGRRNEHMTFEVEMAIVKRPVREGRAGEQGGAFLQSEENTKDKGVGRGGFSNGRREFKVESIDDDGVRNNGGIGIVKGGVLGIFARKSICRTHARTRGDYPFNVKVLEKESPMSLMMGEFTRVLYIRKIFVVSNDGNRERGALKIVFPLR